MEPAKAKIKINYTVLTKAISVKECFENYNYRKGHGDEASHDQRSLGWFVQFEGSQERLYFGTTKPYIDEGDKVKITFEVIP